MQSTDSLPVDQAGDPVGFGVLQQPSTTQDHDAYDGDEYDPLEPQRPKWTAAQQVEAAKAQVAQPPNIQSLLDQLLPGSSAPVALADMPEKQIVEQMKKQTQKYQMLNSLDELMRRAKKQDIGQRSLQEFVSRGGIQVLQQWSKEVKDEVIALKQTQP